MSEDKKRTVIITGAAGNLGSAVVQKFIHSSENVVLTDRGVGRLDQQFPMISDSNQHILVDSVDVTDPNSINKLVEIVLVKFKRIDVLVNTVGGYRAGATLTDTPVDTLDSMINLNTRSVYITSQAVLPHMIEENHGKNISVAARAGLRGSAIMSAYSVSKSAVIRLTESMAAEVKNIGINVICILPGTIDTPQNREALPEANFAKWVKPESLADVIFFLASEEARDINGATIPVYGNS